MGRFIVRRFLWMIVVLFAISLITFVLMHQIPGGPFDKEKKLSKDVLANINTKYHLDDPLVVQYLSYMGQIIVPRIFQGDPSSSTQSDYLINVSLGGNTYYQWMNFGPSYKSTARSVNDIFRDQLPVSAELGLLSLALALIIGVPLGIIAALNRNTRFDYLAMSVAITGVSIPAIVLGPFLIWILAVTLKWLPVSGWNGPEYLIMPTFALGFASSALIARLTRAALLEVLHEDYVRTARAKGLSEGRVIVIHALKNASIPIVTILGPLFATLVTGTFVVEKIFGIPGMGHYFIDSINDRDYPVIMGTVLLYAALLVISNLVVDLAYAWLDPRIRYN